MQFRMGFMGLWAIATLVLLTTAASAEPVADNIVVSQRADGSGMMDIYYDLSGGVGEITVEVLISNDSGASWAVTPQPEHLSGDVGVVANGPGKHILWNGMADQPDICWPDTRVRLIVTDEAPEPEITIMLPGDVPLELVYIPAGTFMMGRYPGEQDSETDEDPQHEVTISQGYYMGRYEVTQQQWLALMGTTPWSGQIYVLEDLGSPAVYVSWNDAQSFVTALNAHITGTGQGAATVRLPSEAEWEYAARAGTTTRFYWGDDPSYTQIGDYAWYRANAYDVGEQYAHVVGLKLPNAFGLYDMSGNVWEWCEDDWHDSYTGTPADGSAWVDEPRDSHRVSRGGAWDHVGEDCRSANRNNHIPTNASHNYGFRLAR